MNTTICASCRTALRQRIGRRAAPQWTGQPSLARSVPERRTFSSSTHRSATDLPPSKPRDPTPRDILSEPTWSVRSLLPPSTASASPNAQAASGPKQEEEITPQTLHHLLRLSALPPPSSPDEEAQLLNTLRSQLHFVRSIQSIDTTGVKPLVSIRDETAEGVQEQTIRLETLREALGSEDVIGHNKRPRRRRQEGRKEQIKGVEDWDVLKGASEKVGRYFVVRSGPGK